MGKVEKGLDMLKIFNSISKQKEIFVPLTPNQVKMYVCGVTVYDHCHLGHARCMVVFDMMARYFRHLGYQLTFVRNITDIDDKIINKAAKEDVNYLDISTRYAQSMHEDARALGIIGPDLEPKATEHIEDMLDMIQTLIALGHAYLADNGDVCFAVETFAEYGKLSKQNIEQLMSGVRIEVNEKKRSPLDFVLWKQAKPGEPAWDSPWGPGRPGWHIECSAMARHHLGQHIDIHGGGLDLQFPHHENEIAQSEACNQTVFANYWLHVGLLQLNQEKMAKSTGNFLSIKDALKKYHPEVIKLFFMSSHYRSPLNFSEENLEQADKALQRLYQSLKNLPDQAELDSSWVKRFEQAMNDDFNTADALAVVFELNSEINRHKNYLLIFTLKYLLNLLGLGQSPALDVLQFYSQQDGMNEAEIAAFISARKEARLAKDFAKADEIRQTLLSKGIELEDSASGTTWRRKI
jgi:cysteinyl-tRNA synthetase